MKQKMILFIFLICIFLGGCTNIGDINKVQTEIKSELSVQEKKELLDKVELYAEKYIEQKEYMLYELKDRAPDDITAAMLIEEYENEINSNYLDVVDIKDEFNVNDKEYEKINYLTLAYNELRLACKNSYTFLFEGDDEYLEKYKSNLKLMNDYYNRYLDNTTKQNYENNRLKLQLEQEHTQQYTNKYISIKIKKNYVQL